MKTDLFVTSQGRRDPIKVPLASHVFHLADLEREIRTAIPEAGPEIFLYDEDGESVIDAAALQKFRDRGTVRLHCHTCREVDVTVAFDTKHVHLRLPPVTRVRSVVRRAISELHLDLSKEDEYLLVLQGSTEAIPGHTPIGTLTSGHSCSLQADLVLEPMINGGT